MYQLIKNRTEAGKLLANKLLVYRNSANTIVFALPRGGVPVAYEIALKLNLPLDLVIVRKLGFPGHEEYAMGAITFNNTYYINPEVENQINMNDTNIQIIIKQEKEEYLRRNKLYRNNRPMPDLKDRRIILVDDGVATGSTITVAIMALNKLQPQEIILAIPVLPSDALDNLEKIVEKVVYLYKPQHFQGVGLWYNEFLQISDNEVIDLCAKANDRNLVNK